VTFCPLRAGSSSLMRTVFGAGEVGEADLRSPGRRRT
jgi:hypothetical protein